MTEKNALLSRIRNDPEDDTVRLVYADWLDENGEPERARFIREQITGIFDPAAYPVDFFEDLSEEFYTSTGFELTPISSRHLPRYTNTGPWCPPYVYGQIHPPGELSDSVVFAFRRGFVDEIKLPAEMFFGGVCGYCAGTGLNGWEVWDKDHGPCARCSATGRVPGLAGRLSVHPLTRVFLDHADPRAADAVTGLARGFRWQGDSPDPEYNIGGLPSGVVKLMPYHRKFEKIDRRHDDLDGITDQPIRTYPTHEAAMDALSAACVKYGRAEYEKGTR